MVRLPPVLGAYARQSHAYATQVLSTVAIIAGGASSSGDRVSTSSETEEVRRLRQSCRNTLELRTMVLMDPFMHTLCRVIMAVMEPLRQWQSSQSKELRYCNEVCWWYMNQSLGDGWDCLCALMRLLTDAGLLTDLGAGRLLPGDRLETLHRHDLSVINEDKLASTFGNLVVGLLGARLQTETCYTQGLPLRSCALLCPEAAAGVIEKLRAQKAAWDQVRHLNSRFWKKAQARSPFEHVFVQQVMEVLEKEGWRATPKVQGIIKNAFSCLGQTKIVEDKFQKERHGEAQNSNRRMALNRTWLTPIETRALSSVHHRFSEPAFEAEQVPPGLANMDNKGFYYNTAKRASLKMEGLVTTTSATAYYSPAPQMYIGHVADLSFYEFVASSSSSDMGDSCWLSILLSGGNICIKHHGAPEVVLGDRELLRCCRHRMAHGHGQHRGGKSCTGRPPASLAPTRCFSTSSGCRLGPRSPSIGGGPCGSRSRPARTSAPPRLSRRPSATPTRFCRWSRGRHIQNTCVSEVWMSSQALATRRVSTLVGWLPSKAIERGYPYNLCPRRSSFGVRCSGSECIIRLRSIAWLLR